MTSTYIHHLAICVTDEAIVEAPQDLVSPQTKHFLGPSEAPRRGLTHSLECPRDVAQVKRVVEFGGCRQELVLNLKVRGYAHGSQIIHHGLHLPGESQ